MRRRILCSAALTAAVLLWWAGVALAQEPGGEATGPISYFDWFIIKGWVIGWLLIAIDVASWAIIVEHFISIRRANIMPTPVRAQLSDMLQGKRYGEMIELTSAEPSLFSYIVHQALIEAAHGYPAMERAMEEAAEERTTKLLRKIELLNIIGNVAPLMGLLGTVYGMIAAFSTIVRKGGMPAADELAGSIGIALVTTFWGLIVAIPALAVYAIMRNRIDALGSEAMVAAQELVSIFRPSGQRASPGDST